MKQVESLEDVDKAFLRSILKAHSKVGVECLYLETEKIPLRYDIMQRRLLYLWHILHLEKNELVARTHKSQKLPPRKGDWILSVLKDMNELGLEVEEREIIEMSKNKFKNIVKGKIENLALLKLNELKMKHSKSENIESTKLRTASYLVYQRLTKYEQQLLFRLRTKTLDVKMNFDRLHADIYCSLCKLFPETQSHILQCPDVVPNMKTPVISNHSLNEADIYGNLDKQVQIVKIYSEALDIRNKLMKTEEE